MGENGTAKLENKAARIQLRGPQIDASDKLGYKQNYHSDIDLAM